MKRYKILGVIVISVIMLTGCIDSMPEMTSEQSDIVSEYAAGLLLKYSPNYNYMLVSDEELAAALNKKASEEQMATADTAQEEDAAAEEKTQEQEPPVQNLPEQEETSETVEENKEQVFADASADILMELGLDEKVSLRYQSFEICDSYPQSVSGFSGVDAAENKKLLVMHFDLENDTDEKVNCQLFDYALQIRVTVNDTFTKNTVETSVLPDDMVSYNELLEAGEKADLIAIAEIEDMTDDAITSLTLQIASSSGSCSVKIR